MCDLLERYFTGKLDEGSAPVIRHMEELILNSLENCPDCKLFLDHSESTPEEVIIGIKATEDVKMPEISDEEIDRRYHLFLQRLDSSTTSQPSEETQNERSEGIKIYDYISTLFRFPALTPALVTICVVVIGASVYMKSGRVGGSDTHPAKYSAKKSIVSIPVELILSKKNGTTVQDNATLKTGDVIFFDFRIASDSYLSLIHIQDGRVTTIIKNRKYTAGIVSLAGMGWEFERVGDHHFKAIVSETPADYDNSADQVVSEKTILVVTAD